MNQMVRLLTWIHFIGPRGTLDRDKRFESRCNGPAHLDAGGLLLRLLEGNVGFSSVAGDGFRGSTRVEQVRKGIPAGRPPGITGAGLACRSPGFPLPQPLSSLFFASPRVFSLAEMGNSPSGGFRMSEVDKLGRVEDAAVAGTPPSISSASCVSSMEKTVHSVSIPLRLSPDVCSDTIDLVVDFAPILQSEGLAS